MLFKLQESGLRFVKTHTLLILSSDPQFANYNPFLVGYLDKTMNVPSPAHFPPLHKFSENMFLIQA